MADRKVDMDACAALADRAAERAGQVLLDYFGQVEVEFKGEIDLVTDADKASERAIIGMIQETFPEHGIYAEESGERQTGHEIRWIIDPLDGTTNYAHGFPIFAVSIAVEVGGRVESGIVYNPVAHEKYAARRGRGATLNGRRLHVSETQVLDRSLVMTGFPYNVRNTEANNLDHFGHFVQRSQGVRRVGSAALDLAYVARGSLDGYWETQINAWDIAAGWLILEEAGGKVTDLKGAPLTFAAGQILGSNGRIHAEMIDVLGAGRSGL